jgi:ribulose-phosphate 3-epimerase
MSIIVPSILTPFRGDLVEKLKRLDERVENVQIDVVDGTYASPATWPYTPPEDDAPELAILDGLFEFGRFRYEVDLMVSNPEEVVGTWIDAGASRVVIHVESTNYLPQLLNDLVRHYGHDKGFAPDLLSLGLSINVGTDSSILEQYLDKIDFVQFMGIDRIGMQGQLFNPKVVEKIQEFKKQHPKVEVQVDGGVSLTTAPALLAAGVDRLVVGSDLWKAGNLDAELKEFDLLISQYGAYH